MNDPEFKSEERLLLTILVSLIVVWLYIVESGIWEMSARNLMYTPPHDGPVEAHRDE